MTVDPATPQLRLLGHFEILLGPVADVGVTPAGRRRVIPIVGGSFSGPHLNGTVLAGGADWQVVWPDGTAVIDTRYLLRTDDETLLVLVTRGFRHGPPEVLAAIARGEAVDPDRYTFRVTAHFEAPEGPYEWLNRSVIVGSAMRSVDTVRYDAYLVA